MDQYMTGKINLILLFFHEIISTGMDIHTSIVYPIGKQSGLEKEKRSSNQTLQS